ncbi:Single-stranded-DNA-specific exonuclease RecJ [Anoxybacillus flavithermus]|uniref:single-stranded-DNA-specific exonuclease RecJ n=1 Tax=Anoxybacillus flavithermus TaxID=33934 RepID=UPI0007D9E001|nr:single-stranded-DNA-specific exonuclease RecJ [Anoxybacillus flavithermus]OAO78628.1 Single-stranded-DNA-specific exonuclease RecJ [Anoxybacillus flavithermus]
MSIVQTENEKPQVIWKERDCIGSQMSDALKEWGKRRNIHPKVLEVLIKRGFTTVEECEKFVFGTLSDTTPATAFGEEMEKAIARIKVAMQKREKIVIFADYDVDGTTACSIMMGTLKRLQNHYKFELDLIIPDRFKEGYGLNDKNIVRLVAMNPNLVITVDCGISSASQIASLKEKGIDVIVTDHHEPKAELPTDALAIVHPKFCNYPFVSLSGAGVAYQLCKGLWEVHGKKAPEWVERDMLDLVALGAICDIMDIKEADNRIYVKEGLKLIEQGRRFGLATMGSRLNWKKVTPYTLGFQIGPRINAAGRIEEADCVVEMLLSNDADIVNSILNVLEERNQERKKIQEYIVKKGLEQIAKSNYKYLSVVIGDEGFHEGVVGIAASKMIDVFYRPTFVLARNEEGMLKGSARSIEGVNLFEVMQMHEKGLLHSWGGHYAAAGLTIHPDNVKTFFDKIEDTLSKYPKETWIRKKYWDGHIRASDINETLFTSVDALEPFGQGFPKITWKLQGMLVHRKIMKNDPDKLRGTILIDGELEFPFIMWEKGLEIEVNTPYTLYGHFQFNDFFKHMEFNIIDFQ